MDLDGPMGAPWGPHLSVSPSFPKMSNEWITDKLAKILLDVFSLSHKNVIIGQKLRPRSHFHASVFGSIPRHICRRVLGGFKQPFAWALLVWGRSCTNIWGYPYPVSGKFTHLFLFLTKKKMSSEPPPPPPHIYLKPQDSFGEFDKKNLNLQKV